VNTVAKILGNKLFALAGLVSVGISLLVVPAFIGGLGANPLEKLLHQSGEIAIWTLGAVLALSPLRVLFPRSRIVAALNRHRRVIGVSACIYGLLHFGFHVLYEGGWDGLLRSLSKPFIWFGLTGLSILVALALTSNNWSIRAAGRKDLETASSPRLRRCGGAHLSSGDRRQRALANRTVVVVPACRAPTRSFDKDSGARKARKYCFAICCERGCTRY
jgi:Predicted membrane protein